MSPPDAIVASLALYATYYSALHRNWSVGGNRPSFRHREPPSRTPRALRAAMRMVAQRPAMVHRVGRAVLVDVKCPLELKGSAEGSSAKSECDLTGKYGRRRENERVLGDLCVPIQDVGWALKLLSETP